MSQDHPQLITHDNEMQCLEPPSTYEALFCAVTNVIMLTQCDSIEQEDKHKQTRSVKPVDIE